MLIATLVGSLASHAQGPARASYVPVGSATVASDSAVDVTLTTPTGVLSGTLLLPANAPAARVPVVLIIAGSGPTDRDGNNPAIPGTNNAYRQLAEALAQRGIASLRYDKRGVAKSAGTITSEAALRFDDYVDDAVAWGKQLRVDARFSTVTVIGHSEGSLIGMLATPRIPANAYVSIAGIARPANVTLHAQVAASAPAAVVAQVDTVLARLASGQQVSDVPPMLAPLFRPSVQPYLISWFRYDPSAEIAKLRVPTLVIQGTTDIQVDSANARALAAAQPAARLVMVEGMNHVLKLASGDLAAQLPSYGNPALPVASAAVEAIATFVRQVK